MRPEISASTSTPASFTNNTYVVKYVSASDQSSLLGATNTSTTLTLSSPANSPTIQVSLDGTGTKLNVSTTTQLGFNYYLLSTPSLAPPVVWTTNSITAGTGGIITPQVTINKSQPAEFLKFLVQ